MAELFEKHLIKYKNELNRVIVRSSKLKNSVDETRRQIIAKIGALTEIDGKTIQYLFGKNIKAKMLDNTADISCPICFEYFKEEHRNGEVHKVTLNKSCGHVVCKNCKEYIHECPICREKIKQ